MFFTIPPGPISRDRREPIKVSSIEVKKTGHSTDGWYLLAESQAPSRKESFDLLLHKGHTFIMILIY
jgi:hypothetical protein